MKSAFKNESASNGAKESLNDSFFRVLCIDDDFTFQQLLKMSLGAYGFNVITAVHGFDAIMQYKAVEGKFGAIITDHDMPRLNGLGFVQSVREMGYKGRIFVMSGRLKTSSLKNYAPHEISGFFQKPFEVAMLAVMLLQGS